MQQNEANRSRILRKNLQTVVRIDKSSNNSEAHTLSKNSLQAARQIVPETPVEKKLKVDNVVVEVVSRRANRGAIQSTELLEVSPSIANTIQATDSQDDLGLKIKREAESAPNN